MLALSGCYLSGFSQSESGIAPDYFTNLEFRHIGPGQAGGRISDIEVDPSDSLTIYFSASTGGIFKTENGGLNWRPVFDQAASTLSIGDLALSKNQEGLVWAGTGEASGEQSASSVGDGIYKSIDGGNTWKRMGLENSRHISRIQIDQTNPDIVYAAATGARWGANEERGLFKTINGGQSWEKVLYISENTGISDVVLHPNGKILLAAAWMQRRNAWAHVQKGPESGLYRSADGGTTWTKLTVFPDEAIGRIALWMAPSHPDIVYACLESAEGGFYRSLDAGLNWELMNSKPSTSYWYGRLYGSPNNPDQVFVMGTNVNETQDGGKTFDRMPAKNVHVDHHVLWINPKNENLRLLGNDGGLYRTLDGGKQWDFISNFPIGQNYAISLDAKEIYSVYGGLQDNGVWGGPSRSESGYLVTNSDIQRICGGDGFYSAVDPINPEIVYGESQYGYLVRRDLRTGSYDMVMPKAGESESYRFNWNTPFFISSHPPHSIYLGGNFLFKSDDQGLTWEIRSPDLSKNEDLTKTLVINLKPVLKPYASITALAESPLKPGYILAGTDDGKLQITLDGGSSWTDLSDRLPMPADRFFTRVIWASNDLGTAYVACSRFYEANDLSPYIFKTSDLGQTWTSITEGFPDQAVIKSLLVHPGNPDLILAGTHNDLLLSLDRGETWISPNWNLPPVGIDDMKLAVPQNDLVLGSYGRGIIILDDIHFLSELSPEITQKRFHVFRIRTEKRLKPNIQSPQAGPFDFHAPDPERGFILNFLITEEPSAEILMELIDTNNTIRFKTKLKGKKGFNRIILPFRVVPENTASVKISYGGINQVLPLGFKD